MSVHLLLDLTLMPTQRWENHTLIAEFRWRRLTLRCLTHVTQAAWQAVIDMCQGASYRIAHNRVHTSTGTSGSSSQSMGINGRMRQKTRRRWRHPQLFPYSYGVCTEEREDQRESKEEGQCQHQSKSCTDRQWSVGRKRKGQRLSKVQPRALCVSDCRRTDFALSRMGPHWDTVYIDQGVSRRGRQVQRQKYQPYRRWRFGDWFWWPVRRSTHRLGDEYFARTRQWIPKSNSPSNNWTAQMQVLMSNPELAQEQFAQWQLIHQQFQHLHYQQQLAASSNLESWQMFHHPGENDKSIGEAS